MPRKLHPGERPPDWQPPSEKSKQPKKLYPGQLPPDWQRPDGSKPTTMTPLKKGFLLAGACVWGLIVIAAVVSNNKTDASRQSLTNEPSSREAATQTEEAVVAGASSSTDEPAAVGSEPQPTEPELASYWTYSSGMDQLRSQVIYDATIESNNTVDFAAPYGGAQHLTIRVLSDPQRGSNVIFRIERGQMICGVYDCQASISFDGKPETLSLVPPADYDSEYLFAKHGRAIVNKLKRSKRVVIELTFYSEGNRQFVFDTAGLKWDH